MADHPRPAHNQKKKDDYLGRTTGGSSIFNSVYYHKVDEVDNTLY